MKFNKTKSSILAAILLAGAFVAAPFQSKADLTFGLNSQFNGSVIPGNTVPWLTATFADIAPNTVKLTLSSQPDLVTGSYISQWLFNLNPSLIGSLGSLTITPTNNPAGVTTTSILKASNGFLGNGIGGQFDIQFNFASSGAGQFTAGETAVYYITGIAGLNSQSFNFLSVNGSTTWFTAAMINGIPCCDGTGTTLAWIGQCPPNGAPEPATFAILGSFIAFAIYLKRRQTKASQATVA